MSMTRHPIALLLWPVWACLLGASLFWPGSSMAMPLRVASSAVLVAVAWIQGGSTSQQGIRVARWVAIGMSFGFLGDAWALVPERNLPVHRLIPAMVLFGLGHLAYITGFLKPPGAGTPARAKRRLAWCVCMAIVLLLWQWSINSSSAPPFLRWSALAYSAILGGTTAAAWSMAIGRRAYVPVAVGAVLFLASDFVLAVQAFRGGFPHATELCWSMYGPGQMLIVYGIGRAARLDLSNQYMAVATGR